MDGEGAERELVVLGRRPRGCMEMVFWQAKCVECVLGDENLGGKQKFIHAVPLFNFCSNLNGAWPAIHPNDGIRGHPLKRDVGICRTTDALFVGFNRNRSDQATSTPKCTIEHNCS